MRSQVMLDLAARQKNLAPVTRRSLDLDREGRAVQIHDEIERARGAYILHACAESHVVLSRHCHGAKFDGPSLLRVDAEAGAAGNAPAGQFLGGPFGLDDLGRRIAGGRGCRL